MAGTGKLRIAVLYGGRSGEHEISLQSAASVIRNLDRSRFEVIPVAIDKFGRWGLGDLTLNANSRSLELFPDAAPVVLTPHPEPGGGSLVSSTSKIPFDVVFPVLHGPLCEDGTIQGLLELADVPYVGCGVLASAVAMDKDMGKRVARDAGIPVVPFIAVKCDGWRLDATKISAHVASELGYPVFVKPANLGSSVGVHKVKTSDALGVALDDAFRYDVKVLIERAVNAREIELAVLENSQPGGVPQVSVPGEIVPTHEFYSYEAKYLDEQGAQLLIPAKLNLEQVALAQKLAAQAFLALECEGMARVDVFLDRDDGRFYFNEINTIPGFTQISMYPKMWEASGLGYSELLSRLIDLALARHARKSKLVREFHGG